MPSYVPPQKNQEYVIFVSLVSQANRPQFQVNPTLAAGDVQVSTDGGAFANLATLPVVTPAGSATIQVTVSAAEMNGDNVTVLFKDATGDEWDDLLLSLQTSLSGIDNLSKFDHTSDQVTVQINNDKADYNLAADQSTVTVGTVTNVTNPVTAGTVTDKTGYSVDTVNDKTGYSLLTAEHNSIADALLTRDFTAVVGAASRSALNALRLLRNRRSSTGGSLTVYQEDDTTPAWVATLAEDPTANPVVDVDPS